MADQCPTKNDIQTIFKRLRSIPTNKVCFDCSSKNPTWSSVTYGVFICIDCSAVHRSLGVHLTFVRSTQLDTNWTWLQLRQMQLGGNANASVFFRQHNCNTADAQQKYTSRAAQLYKEKLHQIAVLAMKTYGTQLHVENTQEKSATEIVEKELDFFDEHTSTFPDIPSKDLTEVSSNSTALLQTLSVNTKMTSSNVDSQTKEGTMLSGPSVNLTSSASVADRKPTIGVRKPAAKKTGLGGKKSGGIGAQKVKTNFAEIEREAEMLDQLKEREAEEAKKSAERQAEEDEKKMASMRLAYKDISLQQKKEEEKLKLVDPKKAEQIERLGMGFATRSGVSHSALDDMKTIEPDHQLSLKQNVIKTSFDKNNDDDDNNDGFFDDYSFTSSSFGMYRNSRMSNENKSLSSSILTSDNHTNRSNDQGWTFIEPEHNVTAEEKSYKRQERTKKEVSTDSGGGDALKKFGNVKAISSDQYFGGESSNNYETKMNLSRFEGSSSISSADFFDDGTGSGQRKLNRHGAGLSSSISAPDLDDVRESVRQGVTKVAGKISSLANGVMSSIQDRYGY